jgi:hypothetical protein
MLRMEGFRNNGYFNQNAGVLLNKLLEFQLLR